MSIEGGFFTKESSEAFTVTMPFKNRIPSGATISVATISAKDKADDSDATATVIADTSGTISGTDVLFGVQAGSDGSDYQVTVTITLDTAPGTLLDHVDMLVRDL